MKQTTGSIRFIVVLLLVGAGLWYVFRAGGPAHFTRQWSASVQTGVSRALYDAGFSDSAITSQVRKEHSRGPLVWVESDRKLAAPTGEPSATLLQRLKKVASVNHCQFQKQEVDGQVSIVISLGFLTFERLTFVPGGKKNSLAVLRSKTTPKRPQVAVVVDDVAYDLGDMDRYAALGIPLTFAILPRDKHSKDLADKASRLRFPVILHLPMEPLDRAHNDPGGAALYLDMTPEQLRSQFVKDVTSVPHIVGINNHMGSAFTENAERMALVLGWVKERHLFFLDSRTSTKSVVPKVAKQVGVPCHVNETFLDNSDTAESIEQQLDQVIKLATKNHRTIAIGHYRRKHLAEALAHKIPEFESKGIEFVGLPVLYSSH